MEKVIYGFSGDPITYGHIDIIKRAVGIFGELIVGIGVNPAKKYMFSLEERRQIAENSLKSIPNLKVISFKGLLVDYAYENNIKTVIRGLRNSEDLNYELMLHQIGASQKQNIDTIYFPANQELMHVSSGAAKALQLEQGFIHELVPLCAKEKLEERISGQYIISITGEIGVGKSYICSRIKELGKSKEIDVHVIDIDKIGHEILGSLTEPLYVNFRKEIESKFNVSLDSSGFINRKELGGIIFNQADKLHEFNTLLYKPLLLKLRRALYGKKGIILLDSALISESKMNYLSNNNAILISAENKIKEERLKKRGYTKEQILSRMNSQFNNHLKEKMVLQSIEKDLHGQLWKIDNSDSSNEKSIQDLFNKITDYFSLNK